MLMKTKNLTTQQLAVYLENKKCLADYMVFIILFGAFGCHRFYTGNVTRAVLGILFFWTYVPLIMALVDLCISKQTIQKVNNRILDDVLSSIN